MILFLQRSSSLPPLTRPTTSTPSPGNSSLLNNTFHDQIIIWPATRLLCLFLFVVRLHLIYLATPDPFQSLSIPIPFLGYLRFTEWLFLSVLVPPPRQLTLERQLNKSILIGWNHPDGTPPETGQIALYHVYVDGILRTTVRATDRSRALIEGVDSSKVYHLSVSLCHSLSHSVWSYLSHSSCPSPSLNQIRIRLVVVG